MKAVLAFIAGLIIGAFMLYAYLWYQVYMKAAATWCQVYSGKMSVEQVDACAKLAK